VGGGQPPTPSPKGQGGPGLAWGGGAMSGLTRASPPQADPGPRLRPQAVGQHAAGPVQVARRHPARSSALRPRGSGDRGSPPYGQPPDWGGQGPAIWWLPPLCQASPTPSLGRAAKFWDQCSLHYITFPTERLKKTIRAA
jgi:hypothetical protein